MKFIAEFWDQSSGLHSKQFQKHYHKSENEKASQFNITWEGFLDRGVRKKQRIWSTNTVVRST